MMVFDYLTGLIVLLLLSGISVLLVVLYAAKRVLEAIFTNLGRPFELVSGMRAATVEDLIIEGLEGAYCIYVPLGRILIRSTN